MKTSLVKYFVIHSKNSIDEYVAILVPITKHFKAKLTLMLKGSTCEAENVSLSCFVICLYLSLFFFVWLYQRAFNYCFDTISTSLFTTFITFFDLHLNKLFSEPILQHVKISGKKLHL